MNRLEMFALSIATLVQLSAVTAGPASAPSVSTKSTLYSYNVTGAVSSAGWQSCAATDLAQNGCYVEHFDIALVPFPQRNGNMVTMGSKQVRKGYSIRIEGDSVTATCADEFHGRPRFSVQGKLGEKMNIKDICEVVVQAGPIPESTAK